MPSIQLEIDTPSDAALVITLVEVIKNMDEADVDMHLLFEALDKLFLGTYMLIESSKDNFDNYAEWKGLVKHMTNLASEIETKIVHPGETRKRYRDQAGYSFDDIGITAQSNPTESNKPKE